MSGIGRLVYFERWIDPTAEALLAEGASAEVQRIARDDPGDVVEAAFLDAHWYQLTSTRGEIPEAFPVDGRLLGRAPNLLAVPTHGGGEQSGPHAPALQAGHRGGPAHAARARLGARRLHRARPDRQDPRADRPRDRRVPRRGARPHGVPHARVGLRPVHRGWRVRRA